MRPSRDALVAQLDRASDFESEGREFEISPSAPFIKHFSILDRLFARFLLLPLVAIIFFANCFPELAERPDAA